MLYSLPNIHDMLTKVMTNHAVTLAKMGAIDDAKSMLLRASQAKVEKKHERIEEYSNQLKVCCCLLLLSFILNPKLI